MQRTAIIAALLIGCGGCATQRESKTPEPPAGLFSTDDVRCFDGHAWTRGFQTTDGGAVCITGYDNSKGWMLTKPQALAAVDPQATK